MIKIIFITIVWLFLLLILAFDSLLPKHKTISKLEQIKQHGVLNVLTRQDFSTYYEGAEGVTGLEYDLLMLFAQHIKVKVKFIIPNTFNDILKKISRGEADIAAAGLTVTEQRKQRMIFTASYQNIAEQIIYRSDRKKPAQLTDIINGIIEVVDGSSHNDTLIKLQSKYPMLSWNNNTELNADGLMYLVNEGLLDYTIADSHLAKILKRFYPKLNIAFDITKPRQLAWALPITKDKSLYNEINIFFKRIKKNKTLAQLLEKHYGNTGNLSYVDNCKFREHIQNRLPSYIYYFKTAAKKHNMDWRLLAAISYQESHWYPDAVSPTGVKGMMMLTRATAKQLGVKDRTDVKQSISGGALYFAQRLKTLPQRISNPDRTWFALAAYNVGFGHLEDARILTQKRLGNPNKWLEVKESLPLLSQKKWYEQTKYGYARGKEPVRYVENIRSYYDLLVWLTEENQIEKNVMFLKKPLNYALNIKALAL